jgi:hypothetical protein
MLAQEQEHAVRHLALLVLLLRRLRAAQHREGLNASFCGDERARQLTVLSVILPFEYEACVRREEAMSMIRTHASDLRQFIGEECANRICHEATYGGLGIPYSHDPATFQKIINRELCGKNTREDKIYQKTTLWPQEMERHGINREKWRDPRIVWWSVHGLNAAMRVIGAACVNK